MASDLLNLASYIYRACFTILAREDVLKFTGRANFCAAAFMARWSRRCKFSVRDATFFHGL
jgi:hypothetical protein